MQFVSMQLCWIPLLKAKQYHKITTNCPFVVSQGMFKRFVQQFNEIIYPSQTNIACQWPKQFNGFASKSIWLSSVLPLMIFFANLGSPIILLLIFPGTPIDLGAHFIHGVCPEHPIACIAKDGWDDAGEGVLLRCKHFFSTAIKREGLHEQFAPYVGRFELLILRGKTFVFHDVEGNAQFRVALPTMVEGVKISGSSSFRVLFWAGWFSLETLDSGASWVGRSGVDGLGESVTRFWIWQWPADQWWTAETLRGELWSCCCCCCAALFWLSFSRR